jgi:hypothetical protein
MKFLALVGLVLMPILFTNMAMAEDMPSKQTEIPTVERDFVNAINGFDKAKIIAQFGEPAKADDVKIKGTNKVVASIWQYHFINTNVDGVYYETTELDFIDDKVVTVVFLNNDGAEGANDAQKYEVPAGKAEM